MSYSGTMISDLVRMADENLFVMRETPPACDYKILGETDGWECGKPAVGSDLTSMGPRCKEHINV